MTAAALVTAVLSLTCCPTSALGVIVAAGVMLVVSYVVVGVGPRTLGRQHADSGRAGRVRPRSG